MNAKEYIIKMKSVHNCILDFIDQDENIEENYQNLKKLLIDHKIIENNDDIKTILYFLSILSSNHHHNQSFFGKIEKILQFLKPNLNAFKKLEIFNIFKNNKRILLFLFEEHILVIDENIYYNISNGKYKSMNYNQFFDPEMKIYINNKTNETSKEEILEQYPAFFFEKRKKGENDNPLEQLILNDSINEFISYIEANECSLNDTIKKSIFENSSFLTKKEEIKIIEYAAFCGSVQIFKYLISKHVDMTKNIFLFAVHGNNSELIEFLESNLNSDEDNISYELCYKEAIKCHHNNIANYIFKNHLDQNEMANKLNSNYKENEFSYAFHYYNFAFFPSDLNNKFLFHYACEYDYYTLFILFLKTKDIDIQMKIVLHIVFIIF